MSILDAPSAVAPARPSTSPEWGVAFSPNVQPTGALEVVETDGTGGKPRRHWEGGPGCVWLHQKTPGAQAAVGWRAGRAPRPPLIPLHPFPRQGRGLIGPKGLGDSRVTRGDVEPESATQRPGPLTTGRWPLIPSRKVLFPLSGKTPCSLTTLRALGYDRVKEKGLSGRQRGGVLHSTGWASHDGGNALPQGPGRSHRRFWAWWACGRAGEAGRDPSVLLRYGRGPVRERGRSPSGAAGSPIETV